MHFHHLLNTVQYLPYLSIYIYIQTLVLPRLWLVLRLLSTVQSHNRISDIFHKHNPLIIRPKPLPSLDKLNFLAGKRVDEVNKMAELGTQIAHVDGGVPNMKVCMPALTAQYIGQLFYFFELACGISGSMLGVNPFDQPGVEAYKNNMFALLDKPGYEEASKAIKAKI